MFRKVFLTLFVVICIFSLVACPNGAEDYIKNIEQNGEGNGTEKEDEKPDADINIALPVFSPAAGDYAEGFKEISIATETEGAEIYYTTDGTEPNDTSSRYTGPFRIIGSKKVRAIAYKNTSKSSVVTAQYNLNAGKTNSQLGVITGVFSLADNLSDQVKSQLANSKVYISSSDLPGVVKEGKVGESFYIDGLDTSIAYDFYFSNKAPGTVIAERAPATIQTDENGIPIVSIKMKTTPKEGSGTDLGQVALKPTGTITGKALKYNENGEEEVDHTGITVFIPGTSFAAYTAKDGSFSMTTVPQGMYTIRAMYSGYTFCEKENILLSTDSSELPKADIEEAFELYYAKGSLKGSVLLSDSSEGYGGIDVIITDATNNHSYNATTTSTGAWGINDITPGTYSIEFHKDGYLDQTMNDIVVTGARQTTLQRIVLQENGGSITGLVSIKDFTDNTGASIIAELKDNGETLKTYYAISNSEGKFSLTSVKPGLYSITATYAGYKSVNIANVPVSIGEETDVGVLNISEKSTYSVAGLCVLEGASSGFEGTSVLLKSIDNNSISKTTVTDPVGNYTFSDVEVGAYMLTFSRQGFITQSSITINVGMNAVEVVENVALKTNAGTVTGNVLLESAETNEGIAILLYKGDDVAGGYTTVTDFAGHFAIAGVTPGTYRVQATKSGYNTGVSDPFTVSSGITSSPSDLQLAISLRSVYGTVKLEGRTDYTGVRITATKTTSTTEIYSALSNRNGIYALSGMTPGEYILSYSFEGYRSFTSASVSLSNDSSLNTETVELKKATGKISGIANLEGCTNHSGITVSLVGTDYKCTTNADGLYEFTVPTGNYPGGVRFEKEDFQLTAKAETIPVLTDSTYGVLTVEMKATANTLKGVISLAGTEDASGIKVTVDGLDSEKYSMTTDKTGVWQLYHIPLGYQTVRFSKINVPDVTSDVAVIASDFIDLGSLEMIPDSATLKGYVFLDGMSDNANVLVTVTTKDKDNVVARTTSDGAFTATNILASGSHTITFSKDGWESKSITIDDFEPLEERVIGVNREYVLIDTISPVWGSSPVIINDGANFANDIKLKVDLSPVEKGSGVDKMSVQITRTIEGVEGNLYPSTFNWQNYKIGFDFDLSELPDQYTGNGTYTLYITLKDKSGNISEKAKKTITVTDLVTSLSGVLTGEKLHLTEEGSPYIVEADCLVSEGDTLVIEPGTEVRFAGEYSIRVIGNIEARGTKEKKILFTSDCVNQEHTYKTTEWSEWWDEYGNYQYGEREVERTEVMTVYWNGINGGSAFTENTYKYVSGSIFEYCEFEYANTPISSGAYINYCNFHDCAGNVSSNGMVILNSVIDNGISGDVTCCNSKIKNGVYGSGTYINNIIYDGLTVREWSGVVCLNNIIYNGLNLGWESYVTCKNNIIYDGLSFNGYGSVDIQNNTFYNTSFSLSESNQLVIRNNNFLDCPSPIVYNSTGINYNFSNNYWGSAQTDELNIKGKEANISFITDYYDNFNYGRVDYSDWAIEPFENSGYSETCFIAFDYTINNYDFISHTDYYPESKNTKLSIGINLQYCDYPITQMRIAQGYEELNNTSWTDYCSKTSFVIDKTKLVNGIATLYIQIKDSKGNTSSSVIHNVPFDIPICTISIEDGTIISSTTKKQDVYFSARDLGNITAYSLSLDSSRIQSGSGNSWGTNFETSYTIPITYLASGTHILTMTATDSAGNIGETNVSFTINRSFDESSVKDISYNSTTGQFYKDPNTLHLWHLDNDGKEDSGTEEVSNYNHINGGFEGAASYLYGNIPLDISTNAYTVEFWTRGRGSVEIGKYESIKIYNRFDYSTSYDGWMYHYYETSDGITNTWIYSSSATRARSDDQWHYWAYVYDGTYTAIYCDGVCVAYQDGFTHTLNTNNNDLSISASGIIDEIRISSNARSADEINSYYKTVKPILDANTGSLDAIVW